MLHKIAITALALLACTAQAHHSTAGIFDTEQTIEITGKVTYFSWRNPHGRIVIEVEDDSGAATEWEAETAAVSMLRIRGADPTDVLHIGDRITIAGSPARRGNPEILAKSLLLPGGYEFTFGSPDAYFPAGKNGNLIGHAVDNTLVEEAIASADGIFRVWGTTFGDPAAFPMFKGGYPLTAAGKAKLAEWDPLDNELLHCGTKGTPLIMITPAPIEFVHEGDNILMRIEEYDARRLIHMSDDAVAPPEHTQFGFSRGHWEGNSLVVETDHIAAGYFDHLGARQSDQIEIVERFVPNASYDRLDYTLSVSDPVYFSRSFELTRYFVWKPEMSVHPYECLERY